MEEINALNEEKKLQILHTKKVRDENSQLRNALPDAFNKICDSNLASKARTVLEDHEGRRNENSEEAKDQFCADSKEGPFVQQSRACLREIDRAGNEGGTLVESVMVHALPQLFPKDVLLVELNRLLDNMLYERIQQEETMHPLLRRSIEFNDDDSFVGTFDSEDEEEYPSPLKQDEVESAAQVQICLACKTHPCRWNGSIDYAQLESRREHLSRLIIETKRKRLQFISNAKAFGPLRTDDEKESLFYNDEILRESSREADDIDDKLRLYRVDRELHDAYCKRKERYIITRALHNYDCMMSTDDAIYALEREQERLVAKVTAKEVLTGILDW